MMARMRMKMALLNNANTVFNTDAYADAVGKNKRIILLVSIVEHEPKIVSIFVLVNVLCMQPSEAK